LGAFQIATVVAVDGPSNARDNPPVAVADVVLLLVIGAVFYAALTPLRRALERRMLRGRERGRGAGRVIPLVRNGDGVYTPPARKTDGDER